MEILLQKVSMPNLRSCALDLPAWTVSTSCVVLGFLTSLPKLREIQLHYFSEGDAEDEERLKQTQALISNLKEKGIGVTLDVTASSIQPGKAILLSHFDEWLPWYPSLRSSITNLDLSFDSKDHDNGFPVDLTLHSCLDFPLLRSLNLEIIRAKTPFYQASRICSRINAPALRHVAVLSDNTAGEPLVYAALASLPDHVSLDIFRLTASMGCTKNLAQSRIVCEKLDLAYDYDSI